MGREPGWMIGQEKLVRKDESEGFTQDYMIKRCRVAMGPMLVLTIISLTWNLVYIYI